MSRPEIDCGAIPNGYEWKKRNLDLSSTDHNVWMLLDPEGNHVANFAEGKKCKPNPSAAEVLRGNISFRVRVLENDIATEIVLLDTHKRVVRTIEPFQKFGNDPITNMVIRLSHKQI